MISTKGRYAIRVMIDLAEHTDEGYISLKEIAERQEISKKYLEIIVKKLVDGGMISATGGRNGGYALCRSPGEYCIGEILERAGESFDTVACLAKDAVPCSRASTCKTLPMWKEFNKMAHDYFYGKTLEDLL